MTSRDSHQRQQPDIYTEHVFGGVSLTTYVPNDEERKAKAHRDTAEGNKKQAEADQIQDGLKWTRWKLRWRYGLYTLTVFLFGLIIGFLFGRFA